MASVLLAIFGVLAVFAGSEGRSIGDEKWQPETGTREEWMRCHGFNCSEWVKVKERLAYLKILATPSDSIAREGAIRDLYDDSLDGCIWLTPEQIEDMIDKITAKNTQSASDSLQDNDYTKSGSAAKQRTKRKLKAQAFSLWNLPVVYKFDGYHTENEKETIRGGFQHWMDNTCVTFREVGTTESYTDNHILITKGSTGCHSYVGRINTIPQQLNLQASCVSIFGTIAHEIGHSLGLWHEQQRDDRDEYVDVQWDNLGYYSGQFAIQSTDSYGVPYDFGSVMHYAQYDGSSNGEVTILAKDRTMQSSMGQRTGLSFADIKIINKAYCQDVCTQRLEQPCQYGGYQDPLNCNQCRCPDGLTGKYCQDVVSGSCGGLIEVRTSDSTPKVLSSPGYNSQGRYSNYDECSWKIVAPEGENIQLRFSGEFGLYCHYSQQCFHWVEVKHKNEQVKGGVQGSRFCCYRTPYEVLESESQEMIVTFRANWTAQFQSSRRGFVAMVSAVESTSPTPTRTTRPTTARPTTTSVTSAVPSTTRKPTTRITTVPTTRRTTSKTEQTTTRRPATTRRTTVRTETTTTTPTQLAGCGNLDIVFVLDSSGSVTFSNWKKTLDFVTDVALSLQISPSNDRLGIVSFGLKADPEIRLTDHDDVETLASAIPEIRYKDSWTNTSGGIKVAREELFRKSYRANAHKAMVIITDGPSNQDADLTVPEADKARAAGIHVYVIAVGSNVDQSEVNGVSGGNDNILAVPNYDQLTNEDHVKDIIQLVCPGKGSSGEVFQCSFEDSLDPFCGMTQSTADNFDWIRQTGATPSDLTGPSSAADGSYYVFIEASYPRQTGDKAILTLPALASDLSYCLKFKYHMYGHHISRLSVVVGSNGETRTVWEQDGEKGNTWLDGDVTVDIETDGTLSLVAERGTEYSGDIAVDDITVSRGACS